MWLLSWSQGLSGVALAATWTVEIGGGGDFTSIQDGIDAAADGDEVTVGPGNYAEAIRLDGKAIIVRSTAGSAVTTIDPGGAAPFAVTFDDRERDDTILEGFTVRNAGEQGVLCDRSDPAMRDLRLLGLGSAADLGGAMVLRAAAPVIEGAVFADNVASRGAHLYIEDLSAPEIRDSAFMDGSAVLDGGAVYVEASSYLTVADSSFDGHTAGQHGGTLYLEDYAVLDLTRVDLSDSATTDTVAGGGGGGIWAADGAAIQVSGGAWTGAACAGGTSSVGGIRSGGALRIGADGVVELDGLTVSGSTCHYGGAIYAVQGAQIGAADVDFDANEAERGGALYSSSADTVFDQVTLRGNTASLYGGGAYLERLSTPVEHVWSDVSFVDNVATDLAGGLYASGATLVADRLALTGNAALNDYGGGAYLSQSDVELTDLTMSDNLAAGSGAGMALLPYLTATSIDGALIEGNETTTPAGWGGAFYVLAGGGETIALTGITARDNRAAYGAFAYLDQGGIALSDSSVVRQEADEGGAILASYDTTVTIERSTFEDNVAVDWDGGVLTFFGAALTVTDSVFTDNRAAGPGGASYVAGDADVTVDRSEFYGNLADFGGYGAGGGAIAFEYGGGAVAVRTSVFCGNEAAHGGAFGGTGLTGPIGFTNNVFTGNQAVADGGAVEVVTTGGADLVNNSFVGNAAGRGGALFANAANVDLTNNIVAYTRGGDGVYASVSTGWSLGYNDWYTNTANDIAGAL